MTGSHRAIQGTNTARVAVAGALTAGALLLAPVGAVIAAPGIANAATDPSGTPGDNTGGGAPGGGTGGTGGGTPGTGSGGTQKQVIRLPGLKIEIKNTRGDGKPPVIKFVPLPRLR